MRSWGGVPGMGWEGMGNEGEGSRLGMREGSWGGRVAEGEVMRWGSWGRTGGAVGHAMSAQLMVGGGGGQEGGGGELIRPVLAPRYTPPFPASLVPHQCAHSRPHPRVSQPYSRPLPSLPLPLPSLLFPSPRPQLWRREQPRRSLWPPKSHNYHVFPHARLAKLIGPCPAHCPTALSPGSGVTSPSPRASAHFCSAHYSPLPPAPLTRLA